MASVEETDSLDIYNFELELREKINELHWKSESLKDAQKELSECRRELYETQTKLEDERRWTTQLDMQLKTATETARRLEEESIKNQTQQIRMKMKCETAAIERDVLIEQARTARLENMDLKIKIQEYERNLGSTKIMNETLETSLIELKNSVTRLHARLHSNLGKLEKEQQQVRKTCEASMKFGERVKAIVKNSHVARERDKKTIEELRDRIENFQVLGDKSFQKIPNMTSEAMDVGSLHTKIESTLKELRSKLESNSIDDKLSLICNELRNKDTGNSVND